MTDPQELGMIVRGSLKEGLTLRLDEDVSVESLRAGKFVVVDGETQRFFSLVTDVRLGAADPRALLSPPGKSAGGSLLRQVLAGGGTFAEAELRPMLMLASDAVPGALTESDLRPVKTIPGHFRPVYEATEEDVAAIFGSEKQGEKFFEVGQPLDMETPVCLNLDRFIERSSGIFGKSGTGKTFLTRLALCGILRSQKAACLIFDMHSEYGWSGTFEGAGGEVRGLKQYFGERVQIFSLDPDSSRRRNVRADFDVKIPYGQIEPEDILLLAGELRLPPTAAETSYLLQEVYRDAWMGWLLDADAEAMKTFADERGGNLASLAALRRRLQRLRAVCGKFLVPSVAKEDDAVAAILRRLDQGISVVLEFGTQSQTLAYMLVANILTRRLHAEYVKKKESFLGGQGEDPRPLMICIEEAHKFLDPSVASQTIFGTIARELRKYNVTLLVVDQRPSGIADDVLSQIGTRVSCLLNDEKDIDAVLTGVAGARELRGLLASLDSKQQALVLGHAVPMPVVIKTRTYDDENFRRAMSGFSQAARTVEQRKTDMKLDFD